MLYRVYYIAGAFEKYSIRQRQNIPSCNVRRCSAHHRSARVCKQPTRYWMSLSPAAFALLSDVTVLRQLVLSSDNPYQPLDERPVFLVFQLHQAFGIIRTFTVGRQLLSLKTPDIRTPVTSSYFREETVVVSSRSPKLTS